MANKIAPTPKQKSTLMLHAVVFVIVNLLLWYFYDKGGMRVDVQGWAYVWPIWITSAWALSLLAHWASLFTNYEDKYHDEFVRQSKN